MIDLQSPKLLQLLDAIGPLETEKQTFGDQMSAISGAVGIHIARTMRAIGVLDASAAIQEAAEIMRRQIITIASAQYTLDGLETRQPQ